MVKADTLRMLAGIAVAAVVVPGCYSKSVLEILKSVKGAKFEINKGVVINTDNGAKYEVQLGEATSKTAKTLLLPLTILKGSDVVYKGSANVPAQIAITSMDPEQSKYSDVITPHKLISAVDAYLNDYLNKN